MTSVELARSGRSRLSAEDTCNIAIESSHRSQAIPSLTGARALAAVSVVIGHAFAYVPTFPNNSDPFWFAEARTLTNFGMALFFVLSGFVIHYNYSRMIVQSRWTGLWNFYVARFARLYPLYVAILAFIFIDYGVITNALHGGYPYDVFMISHSLPFFLTFTQSWVYFVSHGFPVMFSLLYECTGIMWSVSAEWFFYLAYPLLLWLILRCRSTARLLTIAGVTTGIAFIVFALLFWRTGNVNLLAAHYLGSLAGSYGTTTSNYSFIQWFIYYAPYLRFLEFLLGVVVASLYMHHMNRPVSSREASMGRRLTYFAVLLVGVDQLLTGLPGPPPGVLHFLTFSSSYGMALLMALVIFCLARYRDTSISFVLATKPIVLCGDASYSIYLLQFVAIGSFGNEFQHLDPNHWHSVLVIMLRVTVGLAELIGVAFVSYAVLERPARRWLRAKLSIRHDRRAIAGPPIALD